LTTAFELAIGDSTCNGNKSTYNILVWIHEDVETIISSEPKNGYGVLNPFLIILSRPSIFNSFPCENIANRVVTPLPEAREMCMSLID
jgi:hypothetical protein